MLPVLFNASSKMFPEASADMCWTTRIGAEKFSVNWEISFFKACIPPAEVPITTTLSNDRLLTFFVFFMQLNRIVREMNYGKARMSLSMKFVAENAGINVSASPANVL